MSSTRICPQSSSDARTFNDMTRDPGSSAAWLFQGNPKRFDVDGYLRSHNYIYWGAPRHRGDFRLGDRCYIWRAGQVGGLIAVGTIAELPALISEVTRPDCLGLPLFADETDSGNETKVGIEVEEKRFSQLDGYVPRSEFQTHPILCHSQIITTPQGSVFRLSADEAQAAESLWRSSLTEALEPAAISLPPKREPQPVPVFGPDGSPLKSSCIITGAGRQWRVTVESRGGTLGTATERNADYSRGFATLVNRMADLDATITDALVVSKDLVDRGLGEPERRLDSAAHPYPITVTAATAAEITKGLRAAQADVGTERSKGGGNTTRRVQLRVTLGRLPDREITVPDYLTGARAIGPIGEADLLSSADADRTEFEPTSVVDERQKVLAAITRRQGAPRFRRLLLDCYERRCAISGCDADAVLEAAHIVPYAGPSTNHAQNGLLLRADLHTLFDRGLLGVHPDSYTVVLHPTLLGTHYAGFRDQHIRLPVREECWPSKTALRTHLVGSGLQTMAGGHEK
jgi:putative restriction endonuclease